MKYQLLLIIGILFSVSNPLFSQDSKGAIKEYLSVMEDNGFSGSILVAEGGKVIHSSGYGYADREKKIKNTPRTVFTTGSITKPFTGAAILKLEMQGKISTDDLMSKYIRDVPEDKKDITIHHLLTHSSGFPGAIGSDEELISKVAFLKQSLATPLKFPPGTQYRYSNVGFSILAMIIEDLSGMTYEAYLQKHLFQPAGMKSTGYLLSDHVLKDQAIGYDREGNRWGTMTENLWGSNGPGWHLTGNGGILSTVEDMYKYHLALTSDIILSEEARKKHYTRHIEEDGGGGTYYGYGWAIFPTPRNTDLITHNGGNGIFFADFLRYLEEDITIVFMTNQAERKWENIPWEIARILLKPGYKPDPSQLNEDISEAEEEIIESLTRAFLDVINNDDQEKWETFIMEHTTIEFQEMADMDFHITMFSRMHESLRNAHPEVAELEGRALILLMSNKRELSIDFETNDQGRYLISGLSVN
jgi:CubicO group peptidase (beta-lactamase class C family)